MQNYPVINKQITVQKRVEGVTKLKHPDIFSNHFCWTIVGTPGTGKTTFIEQLLNQDQCYKDCFNYILIISPSPINIKGVDSQCITNQLKLDWLYEKINYIKQLNLQNNNILVIFDDCVSQIKQHQNDKMLQELFYNRRHIIQNNTISIIVTTQQYTMFPLKFRGVSDHFTFLSLCPRDLDFIKKDLIYSQNRKVVQQIAEICQEPHQFIYVRLQPFLLCHNFKPLIKGSQFVSVSDGFDSIDQYKVLQHQPKQQESMQQYQEYQQTPINTNYASNQQKNNIFTFKK